MADYLMKGRRIQPFFLLELSRVFCVFKVFKKIKKGISIHFFKYKRFPINSCLYILIFLICSCGSSQLKEPSWFYSLGGNDNTVYGYGKNKSLPLALAEAKASLKSNFKSRVVSIVKEKVSHNKNGETVSSYSRELLEKTDGEIYGFDIAAQEKSNNIWFVALKYSLESIDERVVSSIKSTRYKCDNQPGILSRSLFSNTSKVLKCIPKLKLERVGGYKYVVINDKKINLREGDLLYALSKIRESRNISLPKNIFNHGEQFKLNFNPRLTGYYTLLNVQDSWRFSYVFQNVLLYKNQKVSFPEKNLFFEAHKTSNMERVKEYFIFLYSKSELNLSELEKGTYQANNLFNILNSADFEVKSYLIINGI